MANVLDKRKQLAIICTVSNLRSLEVCLLKRRSRGKQYGKGLWKFLSFAAIRNRQEHMHGLIRQTTPRKRHVTVLHQGASHSPLLAVRAAIVQEFRNAETTEN